MMMLSSDSEIIKIYDADDNDKSNDDHHRDS